MEAYASLHRAALMILVRYMRLGGENESLDETMAALGLDNRNYAYRCRSQLREAGLLTRDGKLTSATPVIERPLPSPPPVVAPPEDFAYEPAPVSTSPLVQAAQIDRMDDSGDIRKPSSPAQARRKAQVAFLQEQGEKLFGKFLSEQRAKTLLSLADESTEIVLGAFDGISSTIEYPYGYAEKKLRGDGESRVRSVPPSVRTPSLEPVREPDYYLAKPTERIAAKTARLVAMGLIPATVEEDDE